jgi:hypothetical protein
MDHLLVWIARLSAAVRYLGYATRHLFASSSYIIEFTDRKSAGLPQRGRIQAAQRMCSC